MREGRSWERDRRQTEDLLRFLAERDPARPFFLYAFFESPHARYDFPPETAIRTPYLADLDYLTMDLTRDVERIHNRYWNSVRHLDTQFQRLIDALAQRDLLDSTLVVVTGDHGEEFLEAGRWGHNSAFSEPQIRVPFVLHAPGGAPAVVDRIRMACVDATGKAAFPMRRSTFFQQEVADRHDAPIEDAKGWLTARGAALGHVLADLARYERDAARSAAADPAGS
jgi:arylsulfatase A-like enzyme